MLSKEEIETCKQEARNYIEDIKDIDNAGWLRGLMWYIEQLESKANKYDSLVKKIKDTDKELLNNYINSNGENMTFLELSKEQELLEELLKEI